MECAEVLVGAVLAAAAVLWVLGERIPGRVRRWSAWAATAACLGAAFMNLSFYVAMGGTFPGLSAANATNEGGKHRRGADARPAGPRRRQCGARATTGCAGGARRRLFSGSHKQ